MKYKDIGILLPSNDPRKDLSLFELIEGSSVDLRIVSIDSRDFLILKIPELSKIFKNLENFKKYSLPSYKLYITYTEDEIIYNISGSIVNINKLIPNIFLLNNNDISVIIGNTYYLIDLITKDVYDDIDREISSHSIYKYGIYYGLQYRLFSSNSDLENHIFNRFKAGGMKCYDVVV